MPLKLVLIGPDGTVGSEGKARKDFLDELVTFTRRMAAKKVQVAIWSNRGMTINDKPVGDYLSERSGVSVRVFRAGTGGLPVRQRGGSAAPVLAELGVAAHEAVLVGNRETDLRAGVNNKLLLIRPTWYPNEFEYGFDVASISELARFCEIFGLRRHPFYWSLWHETLQVKAMGPFSTYKPDFAAFGADARGVAKSNVGEREFWFLMIVSSLYFSGLMQEFHFMCSFPGHDPHSSGPVRDGLDAMMSTFGKCFNKPYFRDLIIRHAPATKSQYAKPEEKTFRNQLNTIRLNRHPRRYGRDEPNRGAVSLRGKTVLVADDFCTNGRSLDVARAYIEAAGGRALLFSWLKTINSPFLHMRKDPGLCAYEPNSIATEPASLSYPYGDHITTPDAADELRSMFEKYKGWQWP